MKHLLSFFLFLFLCFNIAEAQTNANAPGPENVLVVYNTNSDTSILVKNYYRDARGIPESNICPLTSLVDHDITVDGVTHSVIIAEDENIVRDLVQHNTGNWYATSHAWKYFYQYMAEPIKDYIESNNLTDIRYILLVKGVPFYIQATGHFANTICSQAVDGLLCMLGTENYESLLDSIYLDNRRRAIDEYHYYYHQIYGLTNPYYDADPYLTMNNRFEGGVFTRNWNGHTIKLDYLVSHLDGISYDMVEGMIDLSSGAIHS